MTHATAPETLHMGSDFCPRCETDLVDGRLCLVCGYDAEELRAVPPSEPERSYVERYRDTEFGTPPAPSARRLRLGRTRAVVAAGVMAVVALYGSLVVVADIRAREDRPGQPLPGAERHP